MIGPVPELPEAWEAERILAMLGSVASVVGLVLTGIVFHRVAAIRRHFLFKARIPDLLSSLAKHSKALSDALASFDRDSRACDEAIERTAATLRNLQSKLASSDQRQLCQALDKIRRHSRPVLKDEAWGTYVDIQGILESTKHLHSDESWT